jgi:hypothetical protein
MLRHFVVTALFPLIVTVTGFAIVDFVPVDVGRAKNFLLQANPVNTLKRVGNLSASVIITRYKSLMPNAANFHSCEATTVIIPNNYSHLGFPFCHFAKSDGNSPAALGQWLG